jgi:hypothetical protein
MKKLIGSMALLAVMTASVAAQSGAKPNRNPALVVFVVGMRNDHVGDMLAQLIGNELNRGKEYDVITRTDAVQQKLHELRQYEQSGNVDDSQLIEWGRQNNVSLLCLVTALKVDKYIFSAQLTNVKSGKLEGSGSYTALNLNADDLTRIASALAAQLQGKSVSSTAARSSKFLDRKHNSYLAWGVLSAGYPWNFGTNFLGRHGGVVGIGYYLSVGVELGGEVERNGTETVNPLHYSAGLKLFPYKSFFVSGSYGTLGCEKVSRFNNSDGRWGTDGIRQRKGFSLMAGYDVLSTSGLDDGGMMLSLGAGMACDTFMREWLPVISMKWGVAFGL